MRPPICAVCNARFSPSEGGGTVKFDNFESLPKGRVGHPKGLEWFCAEHINAAKALSDQTSSEAIKALRK